MTGMPAGRRQTKAAGERVNFMGMGSEACETVLAVVLVVGFLLIAHLAVVLDMSLSRRRRRARRR